jgi:hypothetical protein
VEGKLPKKKSIWLTYAWNDNLDGDVDFTAQELIRRGLDVKLDRWNLTAGKRLWEQIESFIQDPSKSDGWLLYATQESLGSQACKEEFAYALDRALHTRGGDFPVIALFPAPVDDSLIPAGIRTRLFVSLIDPDWKERIVAAVEKRQPSIEKKYIEPYDLTIHKLGEQLGGESYAIEVRPRAGTWAPFLAGIPLKEKESVSPHLYHGAAKRPPIGTFGGMLLNHYEGVSQDSRLWLIAAANEATPTQSYYILCRKLPSLLVFGVDGGSPQYQATF